MKEGILPDVEFQTTFLRLRPPAEAGKARNRCISCGKLWELWRNGAGAPVPPVRRLLLAQSKFAQHGSHVEFSAKQESDIVARGAQGVQVLTPDRPLPDIGIEADHNRCSGDLKKPFQIEPPDPLERGIGIVLKRACPATGYGARRDHAPHPRGLAD